MTIRNLLVIIPVLTCVALMVVESGRLGATDQEGSRTKHSCMGGCDHSAGTSISREIVTLPAGLPWVDGRVGDLVSLGFELGGVSSGRLSMSDNLPDGRSLTSITLSNGDDLFISRKGDEWEGRMLPSAGGPGWKIMGSSDTAVVERLERGAMICSWDNAEGIETAGLPPARGPFPEESPSLFEVQEIAPLLTSLPGANGVIYLDFDGETVSGTQWNSSYNSGNPIVAGSPNFTNAQITTVWKGVSEDYRPFNVTVTTDRSVYESYAINRRAMLVFTPDNEWYGASGGVAYVDVFGNATFDAPGWVFTDQLLNSADNSSEAASHEAGHMLGLRHDGTSSLGYYEGHGSGATSWAAIMGVGYYSTVTQWSKGEYSDANNQEDDLAIITSSRNGLGYLGDDHSGSIGGATPVSDDGVDQISATGLIERSTDVDVFSFQSGGGAVSIQANNADYDPNLDIRLRLLNSAGGQILESDSLTSLDASLSQSLAAGTYYLEVSGVGKGDLATGYNDYASLGSYTISGTVPLNLELAAEIVSPSVAAISLPEGTGLLLEGLVTGGTASWEIVTEPPGGSVTYSAAGSQATEARFSGTGLYVLRLKGSSAGDVLVDDMSVSVEGGGAAPLFPDLAAGVDLGSDRTVFGDQIDLAPTVTDDSLPGSRSHEWSIPSGSGQLSSTNVENPTLVFQSADATTLRLVVNDGISRTFDEVTLTASFRVETLVGVAASAKAWVAVDGSLGDLWKQRVFFDGGWTSGSLGAGFDAVNGPSSKRIFAPLIGSGLDVESAMYKTRAGCFLRVPFQISDPNGILSLRLRMKFDDGFVAYVNGVEVARDNAGSGTPIWSAAAASNRNDEDALSAVTYSIDLPAGTLVSGENALAIHGMNSSAANNERTFLLVPELEATLTETPFYAAVSGISDPLMRDPLADADGDGRANLYEHGSGTSVTSSDSGYQMVAANSAQTASLVLPVSPPDDVRYFLEYSPTMLPPWVELAERNGSGDWLGQQPIQVTPVAGDREVISFATPGGPRGFFRLGMELVTP